jgi:stage V sporulation protein R
VGFSRINAKVTALPRVGLNPYALGMRLFSYIEELADKGRLSHAYQRLLNSSERQGFDRKTGKGQTTLFEVRENCGDSMFIHKYLDQDFVDRHRLFVSGRRLNHQKGVWEYFVKSRKAEAYKAMLADSLYHPPYITIDESKSVAGTLHLNHHFEGKPLLKEFIPNTMLGIEYLWGGPVRLETTELADRKTEWEQDPYLYSLYASGKEEPPPTEARPRRVLYTMENRKLTRTEL